MDNHSPLLHYLSHQKRGIAMLAISLFPITFAESMAVIILKEAQGLWMAWIKTLKSLTEEKHLARAET
ncbi:hypothetical protein Tco_1023284 [Tanacetum coccineum]